MKIKRNINSCFEIVIRVKNNIYITCSDFFFDYFTLRRIVTGAQIFALIQVGVPFSTKT
jgi:hypothetical protein